MHARQPAVRRLLALSILTLGILLGGCAGANPTPGAGQTPPANDPAASPVPRAQATTPAAPEAPATPTAPAPTQAPPIGIKIGYRAPDIALQGLDGREVRLSDFLGKRVLLNFWTTW